MPHSKPTSSAPTSSATTPEADATRTTCGAPPALHVRALRAFEDNYIWVLHDDAGNALIVDPGDAAPVEAAAADGLVPVAVLLTHHHHDHVGGVGRIRERWPVQVIAPGDARIDHVDHRVADGDTVRIDVLGLQLRTLDVPGHTRSHVAYADDLRLFSGDTLFSLGCGRLFEGTPAQMLASLDRLAALPDTLAVYCGHEYTEANGRFARTVDPGNEALARHLEGVAAMRARDEPSLPSRIGVERACNPFLRCDDAAVREAAARRLGREPADRVECFAVLRQWKDGFRA